MSAISRPDGTLPSRASVFAPLSSFFMFPVKANADVADFDAGHKPENDDPSIVEEPIKLTA